MSKYVLPKGINTDMGGDGIHLDVRMRDMLRLLECAPLEQVESVLDIGMGKGQVASWFATRGKRVTGTGIEMDSYVLDKASLKEQHISLVECSVEKMPFENQEFDCAVMSHVLEHCGNISVALAEVRRVLKDNGWLLIIVPPADDVVCAGHVSVGWSVGQLMYVLLLNGFEVKNGKFIEYGGNVCAFVQKSNEKLPPLRMDRGDISILQDRFPLPIRSRDGTNDGYFARISAMNWPVEFLDRWPRGSKTERLLRAICNLIPKRACSFLAAKLIRIAHIMRYNSHINPPQLS